jgi:hypothetical protein
VVWEESHAVIRQALASVLVHHPPRDWPEIDLTEAYHEARRSVFATCRRVELHARPGEVLLLHRLVLHGMAPWAPDAQANPEGRMIAYLRPEFPMIADWLADDLLPRGAGS